MKKHPYLVYFLSLYWAGFKYPFDRLKGENKNDEKIMREYHHGLTYPDPGPEGLDDAWRRLEEDGRFWHDSTNFIITYTAHPIWRSYAIKFLCSLIAYGTIILLGSILIWI